MDRARTGPIVGPVPPQLARQRVRVELPCGTCMHHGICTIEEQIEQDTTLIIEGVGKPVRLILGCSVYSKVRGPRDPAVTARIVASRQRATARKTVRDADSRSRSTRAKRHRPHPVDRSAAAD